MEEQTLISHLEALRKLLIRCLVALAIFLVPLFFLAPQFIEILTRVIAGDTELAFHFFEPMEMFFLQIKTALVLDILLCSPYIARQIWVFVLPALYENERKFLRSIVFLSSGLFILGVLFCLLVCYPMVLKFGLSFSGGNITAILSISSVVSLALWISIAFGLMFQFPLICYSLIRAEIVSYETVKSKRPFILIAILVLSALLTPPDIISQLILGFPTYLLFELGLFLARKKVKNNVKDVEEVQ